MRRQYFYWIYLVAALVLTVYGSYSLIYNFQHGKELSLLGLLFTIFGSIMLILYLVLFAISVFQKKKRKAEEFKVIDQTPTEIEEEPKETEVVEEKPLQEEKPEPKKTHSKSSYTPHKNYSRYDSDDYSSFYINKVGYGPVLRVTGPEILDMRSNTYYRIEGNMVQQLGSGPVFEISGNRIREAFGSYLYEISGGNVNKVFGGFYASISGNYLQTFDLKEKYEMSSSLSMKQQLAVVAILFGRY